MDKATHDADAARLVELDATKWAIVHENALRCDRAWNDPERLTGAHIDAALAAGDALTAACEAFRRKHYPSRGRVFVGLGAVHTSGRSGRGARVVFDRERVSA